tara:strand:- start:778 stop:1152 length:375 start_codon:yes stop_codon:yes gene_type:complete
MVNVVFLAKFTVDKELKQYIIVYKPGKIIMLLEKPIEKGSIVTVKLNSGEELIARFETEDDDILSISKVRAIAQGQSGIGLIPWMITSQSATISINKTTVVAYTQTEEEIAKSYQQNTTDITLV